jgi:type IX secretion system PorP/SprF family membrane protein
LQQAVSQDLYFSQFYAAHLSLNPALTGFTLGDMQVGMISRHQNKYLIPSYTGAASVDLKLSRDMLKPDILAVGLMVLYDNIGMGQVTSYNLLASGAYHKSIGYYNNHYFAIGAQLGLLQKQIDFASFTYDDKYDLIYGYDKDAPSGESFDNQEQAYNFDLNLGLLWYSKLSKYSAFYMGGATYHLHEPKQAFLKGDGSFSRRFNIHGGVRIGTSEEFALIPNMIVMMQNASKQIVEGMSFEYLIKNSRTAMRMGTWFRHSDNNLIFSAGMRVQGLQFGVSSDFLSPLQRETQTKGALEFSVVYSPYFKKKAKLEADPTRTF